jgi:tRNA G10  N-methylase Trm11
MSVEKVVIGNATLYHGDCREVLPTLAEESVDIILTDPPYGHENNNGDLIANWEKALGKAPSAVDKSAPRPIANDDMAGMQAVVDAALTHAARVLRHDSAAAAAAAAVPGRPSPGSLTAWTPADLLSSTPLSGTRWV